MPNQAYLLDQLATAIVVLDAGLDILLLNQSAEALFEVSRSRLVGEPYTRLFCDPAALPSELADALADGQAFTKRAATLRSASGIELSVDYAVSIVLDRAEPELLIEITPLDRLMRINREDHQASVQETTRKLVRGLAHEIKNPLGGIRGAAQLLDRELSTERQRDYTRVIIEEADRLRNLVDRMLGPSHRPHLAPINLHQVLERVIALIEAEEPGRINIVRDYDPSLPEVEADLEQLIQAVLNIARNAQQALAKTEHPRIDLRTRIIRQFTMGNVRHRLVARIDIVDNGPGIPAELFDRIYYPMISGRAEGSGLGLSIAQSIVNQHHGLIECASRPGQTTFTLYLPLEQPDVRK
ncbi:MAG: nitrogen regulation protein NR(II) [Gammaproteobacteria bacterium]|nr:nitrogen regulation protein NR(II) [Gammaproteobacteria bacterium]